MTVLKAEDMHCEKCVERITKAMTAAGLDFKVSLAAVSIVWLRQKKLWMTLGLR